MQNLLNVVKIEHDGANQDKELYKLDVPQPFIKKGAQILFPQEPLKI